MRGENMDRNTHIGNVKKGKDVVILNIIAYTFSGLIALICLIPFVMILAASFSSETAITANGFSLVPQDFSLDAYKTVFKEPMVVFRAYATTIMLTVVGTTVGLVVQTMTAYVLSRKDFEWRNGFSFFFYFTTLFSGGLVPTYILYTRTLNLQDNYFALLLPLIFSVYNLLIMKSYISAIPDSLVDAARIDGCGEIRTLFQVIMPLIKPALATVGLFIALAYWNDWYNAMLYIKAKDKYPLQYFLYQQVNNIESYKKLISNNSVSSSVVSAMSLPTQTLKMALTVVVTGPIILAFPMVQKYFVQGITIGAVKG
jgi:putative aldouronate transport system permease protein